MPVKLKKVVGWSIGSVVMVCLLLAVGIFWQFRDLAQYGLRQAGLAEATIGKASLGLSGTHFEDISVPLGAVTAEIAKLSLYATREDIMSFKLTKVVADGVRIHKSENAPEGTTEDKPLILPRPLNLYSAEIELRNISIDIPTTDIALPLTITGNIIDRGAHYQAAVQYSGTSDDMALAGQLTAQLDKQTGILKLHTEIADARLKMETPAVDLKRGGGWVSADIDLAANDWQTVNAQLSAGSLKLYGVPLQGVTLTTAATPEGGDVVLQAQGADDSAEVLAEINLDRKDAATDRLRVTLDTKLKNLDVFGTEGLKGQGAAQLSLTAAKPRADGWSAWQDVNGDMSLSARKLSLPGLLRDAETAAAFKMAHDAATGATTARATGGAVTFKGVILPLDAKPVSLNIPADTKNPATLAWQRDTQEIKVTFNGLDMTAPLFTLRGGLVDVTVGLGGDTPRVKGSVDINDIAHTAKPPAIVPVKLSARLTPAAGNAIGFTGDITEKNGLFAITLKGQHDLKGKKGHADINMPPTTLQAGANALKDLFPMTAAYVQDVYGAVGLSAAAQWTQPKKDWVVTSSGELFLKNVTGAVEQNTVSGVNAVIKIDSLMPLTLKEQKIAVGAVNVGLPLTNGVVVASLDAARRFTLHQAEWALASGTITSTAFTMPMDDMTADVTLTATGLQLAELFKIAPMDGLTANGVVDGVLPLQLRQGEVTLVNGVLESRGSGSLNYNPQDLPDFLRDNGQKQIVDLKVALKAFEFESLKLTLDGTLGKTQKIGISAKGKNPEFYDGYPVNINLNVEGPLENVLRYSPGSSQIPENIRKQLEEYEKKHDNKK